MSFCEAKLTSSDAYGKKIILDSIVIEVKKKSWMINGEGLEVREAWCKQKAFRCDSLCEELGLAWLLHMMSDERSYKIPPLWGVEQ